MTHVSTDVLELYSLNRLDEPGLSAVEEHLLTCEECRNRVSSLDSYHSILSKALEKIEVEVHATEDGLIHNWVETRPNGQCRARHSGLTLDGGGEFKTEQRAWRYLRESFREMFPTHRCGHHCKGRNQTTPSGVQGRSSC